MDKNKKVKELYARGVKNYESGHYKQALANYTEAIDLDPTVSAAYVNRGYIYFLRQDYESALADLTRAIELNPTDEKAFGNRGAVYANLQRYDQALKDLNQAIRLNPRSAQSYSDRGAIYNKMQRYQEAIADLNRAIQLDHTLAAPFFNLGALLAQRGELHKALHYFERASQLGLTQAKPAALRIRQELFIMANDDGSIQQATEGFLDATSDDDLREAIIQYPYMILPEFIESIDKTLQRVLSSDIYYIAQLPQLKLLRQIAKEQL